MGRVHSGYITGFMEEGKCTRDAGREVESYLPLNYVEPFQISRLLYHRLGLGEEVCALMKCSLLLCLQLGIVATSSVEAMRRS